MKKLYVVTVELELYAYTDKELTERPWFSIRDAVAEAGRAGEFSMEWRPATGKELGSAEDEVVCTDDDRIVSLEEALAEIEANKTDPNQGTLPGVS